MGRCNAKIFGLTFALLLATLLARAAEIEDANVILNDFKLPEYNKDSKELEFIISGEKAKTVGIEVELENVKIEWVDKDIRKIKATITSPEAVYHRASKVVKGDKEVHFRSLEMDADGVGFDADYEKQTIHIRKEVKVTLKNDIGTMYKEHQEPEPEK